ncbi:ABC-2 type transport system permease protein [Lipingzhangella halophila]|uniref:ABC-2 type transport system permease protein n=1 Tax=Lipingzhangella halophila TaxID=1783352 RepID=A0A7W7RK89_9ACTN|nr:ABC transporter permease subunit [Lipingzhangella halophila]MBB4933558.1 ABC-2 type transport system permease protein [Lipingzhangella halophila]
MLLRNVFGKYLRDNLRALVGWMVAVAAVTLLYSSFWPSMADSAGAMEEFMDTMPSGLGEAMGWQDMTSAEGYLNATVFALLMPILMIVAAIIIGTRAIAGDEEDGSLELVLAHPVSRVQVLVQRFAGVVVFVAALGLAAFLTLAVFAPVLDIDIGVGYLFAATSMTALAALCYGSLALAVGAITGRRGTALAAGALFAVIGYLGNTFAMQVEELEWLRFLSAFYYALDPDPLANGFDAGFTAILLIVPVALLAVAAGTFTRRDVSV